MSNDIDKSVCRHRAKIEQLQHDLWRRPEDEKRIRAEIELLQKMVRQTFGRAGKLLNNCKLVNAAGTTVGCVVPVEGGLYVYRRTRRFGGKFDFVNLERLFCADEIKTLAARLAQDESTYIHRKDWPRIAHGLGKRERVDSVERKRLSGNKGVLAKDLLDQISGDFDPRHFTLAEVKAEYAAVSGTEFGTPVHYDECFQLLEEAGLIAKSEDGSYRIRG